MCGVGEAGKGKMKVNDIFFIYAFSFSDGIDKKKQKMEKN